MIVNASKSGCASGKRRTETVYCTTSFDKDESAVTVCRDRRTGATSRNRRLRIIETAEQWGRQAHIGRCLSPHSRCHVRKSDEGVRERKENRTRLRENRSIKAQIQVGEINAVIAIVD